MLISHLAFYFCENKYSIESTPQLLYKRLADLADIGFDGIELMVRDAALVDCSSLQKQLKKSGIRISAIGSGKIFTEDGLSLTSTDASIRMAAVERLKGHIRLSYQLGTPPVILGSIRGSQCTVFSTQIEYLSDTLIHCCSYAEEYGVHLALEPMEHNETPFINNISQALELIYKINSPALGLTLDNCNMDFEERNIINAIQQAQQSIFHVQVADTLRHYPSWGHFDFASFLHALQQVGYNGFVSVEPSGYEIAPLADAQQGLTYLRHCLKESSI